MRRATLAIAEHRRERENLLFACRQQFLHRELGRRVQVEIPPLQVSAYSLSFEGMQVRLVPGRHLQAGGVHLDKSFGLEPRTNGRFNPPAREQHWPGIGMR